MTSADDSSAGKHAENGRIEDVWAEAVAEQHLTDQEHDDSWAEPDVEAVPENAAADSAAQHEHEPVPVEDEAAEEKQGASSGSSASSATDFPFAGDLGPLVDEVRKFASAVGDKVSSVTSGSADPMEVLQNLAAPLRSSSPAVYGHLLAAGGELIAAYRAAVSASERRWSAPKKGDSEHIDLD
ncbi:DUF5304 family protein [Streptacidiphilus fuscans]|uniref:DUF5304 family protein n=1 Tax=Streptacidiphilus fuscans TaxID=2789292 RepID=A0A931FEX6_9ACTN|nr:DUF5304 family protein [Streptacidiphilus fuscans]MBF9071043.1 DUF5304 family protein [Streptacidiphilus fuscans]